MESIKFTITSTQINNAGENIIYTDVSKIIPWENNKTGYPGEVTIIQSTGIDIGILFLTDDEKNRITNYSTYYEPTQLLGNTIKELPNNIKWIGIKDIENASATGDLVIYCTNYFQLIS